ncbi:esterase [Luteitalea sp. TBR-22]|uniref:alpha/beta hydrolase n=1 Tax=Luteitalea sp. TBR-22 TaxID=2802971 RepID=UPI001AF7FC11|nr:alpha/beta fold hydrolase [Luteitalea sp. TBR-22]BCS34364.1 esterase [Luteitalea sp. TBR-22]
MGALISRIAALALAALVVARSPPDPASVGNPASGLRTIEVGTGGRPVLLLHGYSSAPAEWLPFTVTLMSGTDTRFVFPEGMTKGARGTGRAWWPLDLSSHVSGTGLPDLTRTRPQGLADAAARVRTLLGEVTTRLGGRREDLVLGGFSQGAMVSAEVAFRSDVPLRALVLLSPTVIDEPSWRQGLSARRGLRVFVAHGRQDDVLSFALTSRWAETMRTAGLDVTWVPFDGKHEIPSSVVEALNAFLGKAP